MSGGQNAGLVSLGVQLGAWAVGLVVPAAGRIWLASLLSADGGLKTNAA
jgi:hypothetical protein